MCAPRRKIGISLILQAHYFVQTSTAKSISIANHLLQQLRMNRAEKPSRMNFLDAAFLVKTARNNDVVGIN
jgi:hypothetical protein